MRHLTDRLIIALLLLIISIFINQTQTFAFLPTHSQAEIKWERYSSGGEEFSVLLPDLPSIATVYRPNDTPEKPKRGRMYSTYADGLVFLILSFNNPNRAESLELFLDEVHKDELLQFPGLHREWTFERIVPLGGVGGKQFRIKPGNNNDAGGIVQFYMTSNHVYVFAVIGNDLSKVSVNEFLGSITLDGRAGAIDIAGASKNTEPPKFTLASQTPSPNGACQATNRNPVLMPKETTHKAIVITRPIPNYTEEARKHDVSGVVFLRVVLASSGKVTNIVARKILPDGLTEKAVEAASKIKFIPAMVNGKFVSQYISIEYNFNLY